MTRVRYFRDLDAWQAAMDLAVAAHQLAARLPPVHRFELGAQMRKAAISIPSNIAEGHAYGSDRVLLRHIGIALGSLAELDTQVELAVRQGLFRSEVAGALQKHLARTGQLLNGLRRSPRVLPIIRTLAVLASIGGIIWTVV
jgi:four helix bundle protein